VWLDYRDDRAEFLRSFKGLEVSNDKPAADFWREVDGKEGRWTETVGNPFGRAAGRAEAVGTTGGRTTQATRPVSNGSCFAADSTEELGALGMRRC
jgi:hypothetical protein